MKNYRRLTKSEIEERLNNKEFKEEYEARRLESKTINKQIQKSREINQIYSNEVDKLPTMFQVARRFREMYKNRSRNTSDEMKIWFDEMKNFYDTLETWQLPFYILIFEATKPGNNEKNKSKKILSFLRRTKRNLRYALKKQSKITKIDFTPLGATISNNGRVSKGFETLLNPNHLPYGTALTAQVYRNPIVQSFFEFSLYYSYTKHIKLSAIKAKRIFKKACAISLDQDIENTEEAQIYREFLDFLYNSKGFFDSTNLPTYKTGRPKKSINEVEEMIKLRKQGKSHREISRILNPDFPERSAKVTQDAARIGKALRRRGFYKIRKKTRP